jgi:hypothetical protein
MALRRRGEERRTLIEIYSEVPWLWQWKQAREVGIIVVELLAHGGELILGE